MKGIIGSIIAGLLLLVFVFECAPYLSENGASCPCKDGWKCCQGRCIPAQDTCTVTGDGGTSEECSCITGWKCCVGTCIPTEAECPSNGSPKACTCRNPQDTVYGNAIEVVCARQDYECNALNLCEAGYQCDHHGSCVCTEPESCGVDCSSDCTCPQETICDPRSQVCREPWMCLDHSMCSGGEICRMGLDGFDYFRCQPPTGRLPGDACDGMGGCDSGVCYTGVCLQFCTGNADCPDNLLCAEVDHGELGCVINTECTMPCNGPDEYCADHGFECRNDFCRTSADCPGVCAVELGRPLAGRCLPEYEPNVPACTAQEFVSLPFYHDGYCMIYQACWTDADCPSPYTCTSSEVLGAPTVVETFLCARQAGP